MSITIENLKEFTEALTDLADNEYYFFEISDYVDFSQSVIKADIYMDDLIYGRILTKKDNEQISMSISSNEYSNLFKNCINNDFIDFMKPIFSAISCNESLLNEELENNIINDIKDKELASFNLKKGNSGKFDIRIITKIIYDLKSYKLGFYYSLLFIKNVPDIRKKMGGSILIDANNYKKLNLNLIKDQIDNIYRTRYFNQVVDKCIDNMNIEEKSLVEMYYC